MFSLFFLTFFYLKKTLFTIQLYVRMVKHKPAKRAGDFSNRPSFFKVCRLKAGSRVSLKALIMLYVYIPISGNCHLREEAFQSSFKSKNKPDIIGAVMNCVSCNLGQA